MSDKDGGPAFPSAQIESVFVEELGRYDDRLGHPEGGMSLRDYFAAHAPSEPQFWFQPALAWHKQPEYPKGLTDKSAKTLASWKRDPHWDLDLNDDGSIDAADRDVVRVYIAALREHWRINDGLRETQSRARYTEWPYAWADAMLAERAKT